MTGSVAGGAPTGPLAGVRVLDLTRVLAGPFCTAMLADLGAEVIKIESPHTGDDARNLGPFRDGESVYFSILNRGKKSVTLNLKRSEAQAVLLDLAQRADVVIENFRPGVADRLGIGHEAVMARNPRLVYASISGFGQSGPMSQLPAYDLVIQAASGLMSLTGDPDGEPMKVGESIGDLVAGLYAAFAIATALRSVERTGRGDYLDVSMLECLVSLEVTAQSQLAASGISPRRVGNRHPMSTPFGTYQARDGHVVIAAANDDVFARVASMIERIDMVNDPRFASDDSRIQHEADVRHAIETWTMARTVRDVVDRARELGVPSSAIVDFGEAMSSEQLVARGAVSTLHHPVLGAVPFVGQPVRFSSQAPQACKASPALGHDTDDVLADVLGLSVGEVAELRTVGAL
ncbi:MAG TPA: CoA transferase [Acidimicrobiales bacterium]|nr:CoA transferase [Acidimicrobiales bacterium]